MTDKNNSGPEEGIKGVVEDVKGKAKEAVGTVTGRDDMVREGKAQQDKADAQRTSPRRKPRPKRPAAAPRQLRSARRPSSGRSQAQRKRAQPFGWARFLCLSAAGFLSVCVGMLCVPTLFDAAYPHVLDEQPPRADDEPGAGQ